MRRERAPFAATGRQDAAHAFLRPDEGTSAPWVPLALCGGEGHRLATIPGCSRLPVHQLARRDATTLTVSATIIAVMGHAVSGAMLS